LGEEPKRFALGDIHNYEKYRPRNRFQIIKQLVGFYREVEAIPNIVGPLRALKLD
jgi:hypothetical protein